MESDGGREHPAATPPLRIGERRPVAACYSRAMPKRRPAAFLLLLAPLLLFSSCATMTVWNGDSHDAVDDGGQAFILNPEVNSVGDLLLKIVLTPFTLAFDICTSPIQALLLFGDADPLIGALGGDAGDDCD